MKADVVANDEATALQVGRAAGRLEQVLSEFVDGFLEAKASLPEPDAVEARARALIVGVYRHHILSICRWLEEVVAAIADPAGAVRKRGLAVSSSVTVTVALNMTNPPQMAALAEVSLRLRNLPVPSQGPSPRVEPSASKAPGFFDTVGALAFGIGLSRATLGGRGWHNRRL